MCASHIVDIGLISSFWDLNPAVFRITIFWCQSVIWTIFANVLHYYICLAYWITNAATNVLTDPEEGFRWRLYIVTKLSRIWGLHSYGKLGSVDRHIGTLRCNISLAFWKMGRYVLPKRRKLKASMRFERWSHLLHGRSLKSGLNICWTNLPQCLWRHSVLTHVLERDCFKILVQ
jgi:hypothetical protein